MLGLRLAIATRSTSLNHILKQQVYARKVVITAPITKPLASMSSVETVEFSPALVNIDSNVEGQYDSQLAAKQTRIEQLFATFNPPTLDVYRSKPKHYRMRAEFTVWHDKDDMYYVMYEKDAETGDRKRIRVDQFQVASELLNELMPRVLQGVKDSHILKHKLFQANFHTTLSGESVVTLIYHKKLEEEEWTTAAKALRESLADMPGVVAKPHIVGRSRKQKICLDADQVVEALDIDGNTLKYVQIVGSFSQPNAGVCTHMLTWAKNVTTGSTDHDLLELYCGNGNFTVALAPNFRKVVATEVNKSAVAAARQNFETNGISNVFVARMSSEEFVDAWHTGKQYNRLAGLDLAACDFKTILVDPPRAGLDEATLQLLLEFEHVVYISCNPETLHRDVSALKDGFTIEKFAMFDQFPFTHHVECGVYLKRNQGVLSKGVKRKAEDVPDADQ